MMTAAWTLLLWSVIGVIVIVLGVMVIGELAFRAGRAIDWLTDLMSEKR